MPHEDDLRDKRKENRIIIYGDCTLSNGFGSLTAEFVDMSLKGVGIELGGDTPFVKDSTLHIRASNNVEIDRDVRVVWLANVSDNFSKAGLKYL